MRKLLNPVAIALAIPVLLIAAVAAAIYLPRLTVQPRYGFLFEQQSYPGVEENTVQYFIRNGRLQETIVTQTEKGERKPAKVPRVSPPLYRYDIGSDTVVPVTLQQAETYRLAPANTSPDSPDAEVSPDGFTVVRGEGDGIFELFGSSSSYRDRYLQKGSYSRRLNLLRTENYFDVHIVGWIAK